MKLVAFTAACSLATTMVTAQNMGVFHIDDLDTYLDAGIFARADGGSRRACPQTRSGGARTGQAAAAAPSRSGWSQTSDSSRGSVSAGSDRGGVSETTVAVNSGRAKVTRKRPGQDVETMRLTAGHQKTFTDSGKSRIKVKGMTNQAEADMRVSGARSQMKVDARHGRGGEAGATRGPGEPLVDDVDRGTKFKMGPGDHSDHIKQFGRIQGKGTIRAKIAPKQQDMLQPVTPIAPGEPISVRLGSVPGLQRGGRQLTGEFRDPEGNPL